jgi:hypothetical protein
MPRDVRKRRRTAEVGQGQPLEGVSTVTQCFQDCSKAPQLGAFFNLIGEFLPSQSVRTSMHLCYSATPTNGILNLPFCQCSTIL